MGNRIFKKRSGFTLIELAIALTIAGASMAYTYALITNGILLRRKAALLNDAVLLAKIKLAQIDSATTLENDTSKGEIPGYPGFSYELEVKQDELDLLELAGGDNAKPEDLLGEGNSELNEMIQKRRGGDNDFKTFGIIKVFKIKVVIYYNAGNSIESYQVETFKPTKVL